MPVHEVTTIAEFDKYVASDKLTVIDAAAVWCGPCKMIAPVLHAESETQANHNVQFIKFDVDEAEELAQKVGIRAMPTFIFYKSGKEIDRMMGANPQGLKDKIASHRS